MFSLLLWLLGAVLVLMTITTTIILVIAGVLRRNPATPKVLAASGIAGLLMIAVGVFPWGIASVVGVVLLVVGGGFVFFFLVGLPRYRAWQPRKDLLTVKGSLSRGHVMPVLRLLLRTGMVVGALVLLTVLGLSVVLLSRGAWTLSRLTESLTILLLLEGCLVGAGGAFMFFGYSEYGVARQGAINPAIASDQRRGWNERRLSQQKWGVGMIVAGVLLLVLGLLVSTWTAL